MEDYKKNEPPKASAMDLTLLNQDSLRKLLKQRTIKQKNISMQYFWSSFVMQLIVYSLLSHVVIKYWTDSQLILVSLFCICLYIPFTIVLFKYFKKIAKLKADDTSVFGLPINSYIKEHYVLLSNFYKFKRRYESMLIVCSTAIMIWIIFRIYVPGGLNAHPVTASILFLLSISSCYWAIYRENKRNFILPLKHLEQLLKEFKP